MEDVSSKKEQEEDHTREIEIENAFKTFQEAIALKTSGNLVASYLKFKELAKVDVIVNHYYEESSFLKGLQNGGMNSQTDELSYILQNVKTIRYLFFRNRGFLYFQILKAGPEVVSEVLQMDLENSEPLINPPSEFEFTKELFYSMMDDLANCFIYQEVDELLLRLLYDIYLYMDVKKLARFTLEYARSANSESEDITSLLPLNDWAEKLWARFEKSGLTEKSDSESVEEKLQCLKAMKEDLHLQITGRYSLKSLKVPMKDTSTWHDVVLSFNSAMKSSQDKERASETGKIGLKHMDPYILMEAPIDKVELVVSGDLEIAEEAPEPMEIDSAEQPQVVVLNEELETSEEAKHETKAEAKAEAKPDEKADEKPESHVEIDPTKKPEEPSRALAQIVQRSSRRLKPEDANPYEPDDIQLTRHYYVETEAFFGNVNSILRDIFPRDSPQLKDVVAYIVDDAPLGNPLHIKDFVVALNSWNRRVYTPIVLANKESQTKATSKADGEKLKLMDVLTQFGNQFSGETDGMSDPLVSRETPEQINEFLTDLCLERKTVNETRIQILHHLLGNSDENLIVKTQWDESTLSAVKEWVLQLESDILNNWVLTRSHQSSNFDFATSIYELLVDTYIETKNEIDKFYESSAKSSKQKSSLNAISLELLRLDDRLSKWEAFITQNFLKSESDSTLSLSVRFLWARNYRLASKSFTWREKKHVVEDLNQLSKFLQENGASEHLQISLPNYSNLGDFSSETLHRRLSTASILSIFSKILYAEGQDPKSNGDTISLLENILIGSDESDVSMDESQLDLNSLVSSVIDGKAALDEHSLKSVRDFLDECPIDLKLSLWNILFLYYEEVEDFDKFQNGLEHNLAFVLEYWESMRYRNTQGDRISAFLTSLSFYRGYLQIFLRYLTEKQWRLPQQQLDKIPEVVLNLLRIFEICYVFSLHEEAALITGNKVSLGYRSEVAFKSFKDFFIESITIMLIYCVNYTKHAANETYETVITNLLRLVHQQLGLRRLCDASSGLFLRFSEYTLVGMEDKPNIELAQLLSCRFHFKVKIYDQFPAEHYTEKVSSLDKASATELASFVLPLCFRNNPILKAPRNDMKQVLDDFMEVIGDPDIEADPALVQNNADIEKFIDLTTLTARFIKESFYGLTTLDLVTPKSDSRVALNGLYFLQAVTMFNFYKIRKKTAQSRTVELERIIRLLKDDLMFCTGRVESWILLGQAYGYIVEDDLIWTSDKLNIIDRKVVTANLQRQSLVCYIMAISTMTQKNLTENESYNAVIGVLMNSFVKELYGAVRIPMDMIAFKVRNTNKFVRKRNQSMFQTVSDKPTVPMKFCLKLMQRCLQLAIKSNSSEWSSYYYLAKVMAKLDKDPEETLKMIVTACKLCQAQGTTADPLLEASYKLVSFLYKYVKTDKLSVETAVQYLVQEPLMAVKVEELVTKKPQVYLLLITALEKLVALDKKGWYHKPCYRMAVIQYDEFDNFRRSRVIMNKFFSLKASNKTLLQMWKPENERPGKHFVYMFYYTQFFIKVLRRELDLSALIQILPKLRKANSTMVSLYFAWENLCSSICKLVRVICEIDDNFVELALYKHSQNSFTTQATAVVETVKLKGIQTEQKSYFCYLQVLTEMRKLNNGFGPTLLIDDTLCAVFLKIFNDVSVDQQAPPVSDLTAVKFKRLAKRDLFPFVNDIAAKCKRDIDGFLKDDPDIFNTYVANYIEHQRLLGIQKEGQQANVAGPIEQSQALHVVQSQVSNSQTRSPQIPPSHPYPNVHREASQTIPSGLPPPTVFTTRNYTKPLSSEASVRFQSIQNSQAYVGYDKRVPYSMNPVYVSGNNPMARPEFNVTGPNVPGYVYTGVPGMQRFASGPAPTIQAEQFAANSLVRANTTQFAGTLQNLGTSQNETAENAKAQVLLSITTSQLEKQSLEQKIPTSQPQVARAQQISDVEVPNRALDVKPATPKLLENNPLKLAGLNGDSETNPVILSESEETPTQAPTKRSMVPNSLDVEIILDDVARGDGNESTQEGNGGQVQNVNLNISVDNPAEENEEGSSSRQAGVAPDAGDTSKRTDGEVTDANEKNSDASSETDPTSSSLVTSSQVEIADSSEVPQATDKNSTVPEVPTPVLKALSPVAEGKVKSIEVNEEDKVTDAEVVDAEPERPESGRAARARKRKTDAEAPSGKLRKTRSQSS